MRRNDPPTHYDQQIEPWDVIDAWRLCFWLGNVIKYVCRAGKKGDYVEDLEKARDYLNEAIRRAKGS